MTCYTSLSIKKDKKKILHRKIKNIKKSLKELFKKEEVYLPVKSIKNVL